MSNLEEWSKRVDDDGQENNKAVAKEPGSSCSSSESEQCGTCRCAAGTSQKKNS